ncbi:hypothetical protein C8R43DRAFT_1136381 [Mycena crocata]|nr:hypothetical protein C8R43DRAFT_1136381 [Mycena crocata]
MLTAACTDLRLPSKSSRGCECSLQHRERVQPPLHPRGGLLPEPNVASGGPGDSDSDPRPSCGAIIRAASPSPSPLRADVKSPTHPQVLHRVVSDSAAAGSFIGITASCDIQKRVGYAKLQAFGEAYILKPVTLRVLLVYTRNLDVTRTRTHIRDTYIHTINANASANFPDFRTYPHPPPSYALCLTGTTPTRAESPSYTSCDTSPPGPGPWPAAFYAQVWCTYRVGFQPIRDLPGLASLPPPLVIPGMDVVGASVSSANLGSLSALTNTPPHRTATAPERTGDGDASA